MTQFAFTPSGSVLPPLAFLRVAGGLEAEEGQRQKTNQLARR